MSPVRPFLSCMLTHLQFSSRLCAGEAAFSPAPAQSFQIKAATFPPQKGGVLKTSSENVGPVSGPFCSCTAPRRSAIHPQETQFSRTCCTNKGGASGWVSVSPSSPHRGLGLSGVHKSPLSQSAHPHGTATGLPLPSQHHHSQVCPALLCLWTGCMATSPRGLSAKASQPIRGLAFMPGAPLPPGPSPGPTTAQ